MKLYGRHKTTLRLFIALTVLGFFLSFTQPSDLPLILLPAPFLLIFYISYVLFQRVVQGITKQSSGRGRFVAVLLALFPTLTLLLSTLNQLSSIDLAVVGLLLVGGLFYLRYADFLS